MIIWFFLVFSRYFYPRSQMSSLAIFEKVSTIFHKTLFFAVKVTPWRTGVVLRWKSKYSPFQNTNNYWNRRIIRDEILNLVMESINFTWSSVNWRHIGGLSDILVVWHSDHQYTSNLRVPMSAKSKSCRRDPWFLRIWKKKQAFL